MDVLLFFVLVFIVIIFGVIAAVVALIVISKNKKQRNMLSEEYIRAEVVKTNTNIRTMNTVNSKYLYDHTQYFVEFKDDLNNTFVLNCNRKTFESLLPGFYGDVIYKGSKLVSFERLKEHEERRYEQQVEDGYFFEKSTQRSRLIMFYCDAPSLGVNIPADEPIKLDVDEVYAYIDRMMENTTENFFGLDNEQQVIQFFNEGDNNQILIDIPNKENTGSYQAIIYGLDKLKVIVKAYYNYEDVFELADFELMQF